MKRDEGYHVIGAILVGLIFLYGVLAFFQTLSNSPLWTERGAAWVQAVGSIAAILGAYHLANRSYRLAQDDQQQRASEDEANTLLSFKYLANEIRRMITLAGFQIDAPGNRLIYPDISSEFSAMCKQLEQLSVQHIASRQCMGHWLHLRRVAIHMSALYSVAPQQGDGFYFQHRNRIHELDRECSQTAAEIGRILKDFAPALYQEHEAELGRL